MTNATRIIRAPSPPLRPQSTVGTMVFGAPPPQRRVSHLGTAAHRVLRSAVAEERRAGVFLFALNEHQQVVGRLWLAASHSPRGGTLGRHEAVDLPLGVDAALSLRHLLLVVRIVDRRVRYTVVDLETTAGLHTLHGQQRVIEAEHPVLLRTAQLTFCCAPTGPGVGLPADEVTAWTMAPRARRPRSLMESLLGGPSGVLTLHLGEHHLPLSVDDEMLTRGVLLGRHTRCDVIIPDQQVSRVHAVVMNVDGVPYGLDAGSSNRSWTAAGELKCHRLEEGDQLLLGRATVSWRRLR